MPFASRLPALQHRNFRRYITGSFISNVGTQVQSWAIAWQIYQLTHSSLMVGMLGLVRVVPLLLFTLVGGVVADHTDRRKVMLITQTVMMFQAFAVFGLTYGGHITVAWLYVLVGIGSVARAFDGPSRQAMFASLVPREVFPNAASLNGIAWQLSDVLGPMFAGLFIAIGFHGLSICYLFNAISFMAVLYAVWLLPPRMPLPDGGELSKVTSIRDGLHLIKEGLVFVNRTPVVKSAMWIDFWATFFSGAQALIPAIAGPLFLNLGPTGYGILGASSAVGGMIAAATLAWLPTIVHQGRWVIAMIACYGLFTIGFGFSFNLPMAALFLALVGASDMISTVLRQTIRQLATPDQMRGRMSATSSLFHISGPQLGDFEAGALASFTGERASIAIGGALCMLVAGRYMAAPSLRDYQHA